MGFGKSGKEALADETQDRLHGKRRLSRNYATVAPSSAQSSLQDLHPKPEEIPAEWAVIVNHGMGQQVHFETLEAIALALRSAEIRSRKDAEPIRTRVVELFTLDGRPIELVRAEMIVQGADGKPRGVHIYESYWAPLTEGRVTLRDVVRFLGEGALNGFGYLVHHFTYFDRWAFGKLREFHIRGWLTALKLVFALAILFAPVAFANFLAVTQSLHLLFSAMTTTPTGPAQQSIQLFVTSITPYVWRFEICLAAFAFGTIVLPKFYRSKLLAVENSILVVARWVVHVTALILTLGALVALIIVEIGFFKLVWEILPALLKHQALPMAIWPLWRLAVIWCAAVVAAFVSRWFLIEFIGDVAVYVSAHKLSKFDQLRDAIKQSVLDVMGAVYTAKILQQTPPGDLAELGPVKNQPFQYSKIIVAGHSLGSVISYDLLNQLLLEDELHGRRASTPSHGFRDIRNRTKLLLTFGSPLDKIVYLFRIKKSTDELREAAIAAWQPMIRDYAYRPDNWVNIYSWMDLFSAPLYFYDDQDDKEHGGDKRVQNCVDSQAWVPVVSHTAYWTGDLLGNALYRTITR